MTSYESPQKDMTVILSTLKGIAAAVIHAAEAGSLQQVLQQIAYVAQRLVRSRFAALGVPGERGTMKFFEVAGLSADQIRRIDHPPIGRGLLGVIMHERAVLRLEHIDADPRSVGFPAHHPHMDRLLGVPVQVGEQLFGMLYLTDRLDGQPFDEQDQWLVETLAGYAALAIAGNHLSERHSRLALLEERERVGMALHDGIIQSLYAIGMQLQLLKMTQPAIDEELSKATLNLDNVIGDIRRYILNLKIVDYQQQTMRACLVDVVARLHIPQTLHVIIDAPERQPPFAPPMVEAVCQIAYEAVSNVVRHANATELGIAARESDNSFYLVIRDNGQGFAVNADSPAHGGLGLHNIAQRARIHGGDVDIQSIPGEGTCLTLQIPI
jgi:signal transduction histidine kinase